MRRIAGATAVLAALLAHAAPAGAQHGNGLYEPFPRAAVKERAKRFVERLPGRARERRFTDLELARGVFVSGGLPRARSLRPASARAGGGGDGSIPVPLEALLVLLAAGAAPALALGRARGGATGA